MSRAAAKVTQADGLPRYIYFVRAGEHVKIGVTRHWKQRVASMQVGSPYTIVPMLVLLGDASLERKLHKKFVSYHFRGEWFRFGEGIRNFIKENKSDCVMGNGSPRIELPEPPMVIL